MLPTLQELEKELENLVVQRNYVLYGTKEWAILETWITDTQFRIWLARKNIRCIANRLEQEAKNRGKL